MAGLVPSDVTAADGVALGWFLLAWLGYGRAIQAMRHPASVTVRLHEIRRAWMRVMLVRDNRIVDSSLIGHTVHSATFFASTTMVALAALLGVLGNFEHGFATLAELTFTAKTSRALVETKVMLLVLVLAHTFLKLSWSLRQLNYCIALIGAAPARPAPGRDGVIADRIATVLSLAIGSFNAGIRGYYFALAVLAWLFGPGGFALVTTGIIVMLLWRQFGSETAEAIRLGHNAYAGGDSDAAGRAAGADPAAPSAASVGTGFRAGAEPDSEPPRGLRRPDAA